MNETKRIDPAKLEGKEPIAAMRKYEINCRYNNGYRRYRQNAMIVSEIEVSIKERR